MNSNKLKAKIVECGFSYKHMSELLELSRPSFFSKLRGQTQFKLNELQTMICVLNLSEDEIIKIFFE